MTKEEILKEIEEKGYLIDYFPTDFNDDEDVVLKYVEINLSGFEHASERLKNDVSFAKKICKINVQNFKLCGKKPRSNKELARYCVKEYHLLSEYITGDLLNDLEFAKELVDIYGSCIKPFSNEIKKNRDLILKAVKWGASIDEIGPYFINDKEIVMAAVLNGDSYELLSERLRDDFDVTYKALSKNGMYLEFASDRLKGNKEICLRAVRKDYEAFGFVSESLKFDDEIVEEALRTFKDFVDNYYYDRDYDPKQEYIFDVFSESAIKINLPITRDMFPEGVKLPSLDKIEELLNVKELTMTEILDIEDKIIEDIQESKYSTLFDADKIVFKDRAFIYQLNKYYDSAPREMDDSLKSDKALLLAICSVHGNNLSFASEQLQNDLDVAVTAIFNNMHAIYDVGDEIESSEEFFEVFSTFEPNFDLYCADELKNNFMLQTNALTANSTNKEIDEILTESILHSYEDEPYFSKLDGIFTYEVKNMLSDLEFEPELIKNFDEKFTKNKKFIYEALRVNSDIFEFLDESYKKDEFAALTGIKCNPYCMQFLDNSLLSDKSFALKALKINGNAYSYLDESLKRDRGIIFAALAQSVYIFEDLPENIKNDKDIVAYCLLRDPSLLEYVNEEFQDDYELVKDAVRFDPDVLEYASDRLRKNKEICLIALRYGAWAIDYVDESLKDDPDILKYVSYEDE